MSPPKIKLLFIIESLNNGGAEMLAIRLSEKIDHKVFHPMICSLSDAGPLRKIIVQKKIELFSLGKQDGKDFGLPSRLRKIVKENKIDIIHTHNQGPLLYSFLATRFLVRPPLRTHTEHINMEVEFSYSLRHRIIQKFLFQSLDGFISISTHLTEYFSKRFALGSKIVTIPNGIDFRIYESITRNDNLRQELGLSRDILLVGNISALREQKDHITLIRAVSLLTNNLPHLRLVIAGEGEEKEFLKDQVRKYGLNEMVFFLGYRSDITHLLAGFDIFVLPSLYEGLPLCLLEAMAAGLPIVTTDVMGNNELIQNEINGLLVPPRDPEALAHAILRLANDHIMASNLALKARDTVRQQYNFDTLIKHYEIYYQKWFNHR